MVHISFLSFRPSAQTNRKGQTASSISTPLSTPAEIASDPICISDEDGYDPALSNCHRHTPPATRSTFSQPHSSNSKSNVPLDSIPSSFSSAPHITSPGNSNNSPLAALSPSNQSINPVRSCDMVLRASKTRIEKREQKSTDNNTPSTPVISEPIEIPDSQSDGSPTPHVANGSDTNASRFTRRLTRPSQSRITSLDVDNDEIETTPVRRKRGRNKNNSLALSTERDTCFSQGFRRSRRAAAKVATVNLKAISTKRNQTDLTAPTGSDSDIDNGNESASSDRDDVSPPRKKRLRNVDTDSEGCKDEKDGEDEIEKEEEDGDSDESEDDGDNDESEDNDTGQWQQLAAESGKKPKRRRGKSLQNVVKRTRLSRLAKSVPLPKNMSLQERLKNRTIFPGAGESGATIRVSASPQKKTGRGRKKRKATNQQSTLRKKRKRTGRTARVLMDDDDEEDFDVDESGNENDFFVNAEEEEDTGEEDEEEEEEGVEEEEEEDVEEEEEAGDEVPVLEEEDCEEEGDEEEEEEVELKRRQRSRKQKRYRRKGKKGDARRKRTEPTDIFNSKSEELSANEQKERLDYLVNETARIASSLHEALVAPEEDVSKSESTPGESLKSVQKKEEAFQAPNGEGCMLQRHQMEGVNWLLTLDAQGLNAILADEMGLGKTIQAVSFLASLVISGSRGPHLVIAPKNVCEHWVDEIERFYPGQLSVVSHLGPAEDRLDKLERILDEDNFDIMITSYEVALRDLFTKKKSMCLPSHCLSTLREFRKVQFEYLVVDEAQRLKNDNSQMNMAIRNYKNVQRRLLLTGTPLSNSLRELWSLMNILNPRIFSSKSTFESWFSAPFENLKGKKRTAMTHTEKSVIVDRLHTIIRPFFRRRERKDVCPTFTSADEVIVQCPMSLLQRALMYHFQRRASEREAGVSNILMAMREVSNHPFSSTDAFDEGDNDNFATPKLVALSGKFSFLHYSLPRLVASGHRILLFSQFRTVLDFLEDLMEILDIRYGRLDGTTKSEDRVVGITEFNAPRSEIPIFLLTTRSGGVGLNLQTADTVILFDSDWNPSADLQAVSRIQRIGQKRTVHIMRLVSEDSIDSLIVETADHKRKTQAVAVAAGKFHTSVGATRDQKIRQRDLEELLEKLETKKYDDGEQEKGTPNAGGETSMSTASHMTNEQQKSRLAAWDKMLIRPGETKLKTVEVAPIWIDSTPDSGMASVPKWLQKDADLVAASRAITCSDQNDAMRMYESVIQSRARVGAFSKQDRAKRACRNALQDYSDFEGESGEEIVEFNRKGKKKSDDDDAYSIAINQNLSESDDELSRVGEISDSNELIDKRGKKSSKVLSWTMNRNGGLGENDWNRSIDGAVITVSDDDTVRKSAVKPSTLTGSSKDSLKTMSYASGSPCGLSGVADGSPLKTTSTGSNRKFTKTNPMANGNGNGNVPKEMSKCFTSEGPMHHQRVLPLSSNAEDFVDLVGDDSEIVMGVPLASLVQGSGSPYIGKGKISDNQRKAIMNNQNDENNNKKTTINVASVSKETCIAPSSSFNNDSRMAIKNSSSTPKPLRQRKRNVTKSIEPITLKTTPQKDFRGSPGIVKTCFKNTTTSLPHPSLPMAAMNTLVSSKSSVLNPSSILSSHPMPSSSPPLPRATLPTQPLYFGNSHGVQAPVINMSPMPPPVRPPSLYSKDSPGVSNAHAIFTGTGPPSAYQRSPANATPVQKTQVTTPCPVPNPYSKNLLAQSPVSNPSPSLISKGQSATTIAQPLHIVLPLMNSVTGAVDLINITVPLRGSTYDRVSLMSKEALKMAKAGNRMGASNLCSNISGILQDWNGNKTNVSEAVSAQQASPIQETSSAPGCLSTPGVVTSPNVSSTVNTTPVRQQQRNSPTPTHMTRNGPQFKAGALMVNANQAEITSNLRAEVVARNAVLGLQARNERKNQIFASAVVAQQMAPPTPFAVSPIGKSAQSFFPNMQSKAPVGQQLPPTLPVTSTNRAVVDNVGKGPTIQSTQSTQQRLATAARTVPAPSLVPPVQQELKQVIVPIVADPQSFSVVREMKGTLPPPPAIVHRLPSMEMRRSPVSVSSSATVVGGFPTSTAALDTPKSMLVSSEPGSTGNALKSAAAQVMIPGKKFKPSRSLQQEKGEQQEHMEQKTTISAAGKTIPVLQQNRKNIAVTTPTSKGTNIMSQVPETAFKKMVPKQTVNAVVNKPPTSSFDMNIDSRSMEMAKSSPSVVCSPSLGHSSPAVTVSTSPPSLVPLSDTPFSKPLNGLLPATGTGRRSASGSDDSGWNGLMEDNGPKREVWRGGRASNAGGRTVKRGTGRSRGRPRADNPSFMRIRVDGQTMASVAVGAKTTKVAEIEKEDSVQPVPRAETKGQKEKSQAQPVQSQVNQMQPHQTESPPLPPHPTVSPPLPPHPTVSPPLPPNPTDSPPLPPHPTESPPLPPQQLQPYQQLQLQKNLTQPQTNPPNQLQVSNSLAQLQAVQYLKSRDERIEHQQKQLGVHNVTCHLQSEVVSDAAASTLVRRSGNLLPMNVQPPSNVANATVSPTAALVPVTGLVQMPTKVAKALQVVNNELADEPDESDEDEVEFVGVVLRGNLSVPKQPVSVKTDTSATILPMNNNVGVGAIGVPNGSVEKLYATSSGILDANTSKILNKVSVNAVTSSNRKASVAATPTPGQTKANSSKIVDPVVGAAALAAPRAAKSVPGVFKKNVKQASKNAAVESTDSASKLLPKGKGVISKLQEKQKQRQVTPVKSGQESRISAKAKVIAKAQIREFQDSPIPVTSPFVKKTVNPTATKCAPIANTLWQSGKAVVADLEEGKQGQAGLSVQLAVTSIEISPRKPKTCDVCGPCEHLKMAVGEKMERRRNEIMKASATTSPHYDVMLLPKAKK